MPDFTFETIVKINGIFATKGWPIDGNKSYSAILKMSEMLNGSELSLVLDLLADCSVIEMADYIKYSDILVEKIIAKFPGVAKFACVSIKSNKDLEKSLIKTSDMFSIFLRESFRKNP